MEETKVFEAYARLMGLKTNLPQANDLDMKWVEEYHNILGVIEKETGKDYSSFKVPESETPVRKIQGNYITENSPYYYVKTCNRSFLMMKIDGFISFFELLTESQKSGKPQVGFNPPKVS